MSLDIEPRLKKDFREGLLKVCNTPGEWDLLVRGY